MRRRFAARQRERGAVLVETVVVLPLVLLLVFGIVEWSAAYHDSSVTADAARAGGRIASAQARNPDYATNAAASVAAALSTLPSNAPQELWIYKANSNGYPGTGTDFCSCGSNCIKYVWNPSTKQFNTAAPAGWRLAGLDPAGLQRAVRPDRRLRQDPPRLRDEDLRCVDHPRRPHRVPLRAHADRGVLVP